MKKFFTVSLLFVLGLVLAQETAPTQAQQEVSDEVRMRVIHLSPNVPEVGISLTSTQEGGETIAPEGLTGLSYESGTNYLSVPPGEYTVTATSEGNTVLEQEAALSPGISYTVALVGLVLPEEGAEPEEEGGFIGFIQNLFSGDRERDSLALQLLVVQDNLDTPLFEGESLVRLIHAAPGTDAVDLTVAGEGEERETLLDSVEFASVSNYAPLPANFSDPAVAIAGSDAASLEVSGVSFEPDTVTTLFVTGTSLEQAPLNIITLSNEPRLSPTALGTSTTGTLGAATAAQSTAADVVLNTPELSTLGAALEQAEMLEVLRGSGPFTLFAPNEAAFDALPPEQLDALLADPDALTRVLNHHVIQGALPSAEFADAGSVATLDESELEMAAEDGSLTVNNAAVVTSDVQTINGVIHVIDKVLLPDNLELQESGGEESGGGS